MAELDIGKHCSAKDCKQLDFLPFQCDGCGEIFCKEHQVKDIHCCSRKLKPLIERSETTPYMKYSCHMTDCDKTELVPVPCDKCHNNYCMQHRHAVDHQCSGLEVKPKYMSATAEHVQKILENKPVTAAASKPRVKSQKAQEMAARVALMKMKQTATGDSGVPQESRVYLSIQLPSRQDTEIIQTKCAAYWLDKQWSVGRAVDYISDKAKLKNENNKSDKPKLRLRTPNAGIVLDMESKLEQLLTDKMIYNGSTLELCYIDSFLTS